MTSMVNDFIISVIVPVFNVENTIDRCLSSIVKSSLKCIEIIVVNDATPDHSMDIVNSYAVSDNRIKIINKTINEGLMAARRTGIDAASADYIYFCDSDDYLPPDALEIMYKAIAGAQADIAIGDLAAILLSGVTRLIKTQLPYGSDNESVIKAILRGECSHSLCNKMFSRELLSRPGIQTFTNYTNGEDGALLFQILPFAKRIVQVHDPVYNYIHNASSSTRLKLSAEGNRKWLFGMNFMYSTIREHYGKEFDEDINYNALASFRHYGLAGGSFSLLRSNFPELQQEIYLNKAIRSFGFIKGLHYYLITSCKLYRILYNYFYKRYSRLRVILRF